MSSEEPLPPGWIVRKSKTHKREYFFNTRTGESLWERPAAPAAAEAKAQAPAPPPATNGAEKAATADAAHGAAPDGGTPRRKRQRPQGSASSGATNPAIKRPVSGGGGGGGGISSFLQSAKNIPVMATEKFKTRAELAQERFYQQKTKFRGEVEATLRSFMADEDASEHRFSPCDKEDRTVIHEVAAQLGLVSESEGENYERHAVVYKPGSEPEHLRPEAQEAAQEAQRLRIEAQARAAKQARLRAQAERERERQQRKADGQGSNEVFVAAVARREREISMEQALLQAGWGAGKDKGDG